MACSIIDSALLLLMKHLVGQCQKAPDCSAFHWPPHGNLVSIGQHKHKGSTFTEKGRNKHNYRFGPKRT